MASFRWQTRERFDETPYSYHPYAYALSNPVNWVDPTGQFCLDAVTAVFCGIGAVAGTTVALAGAVIVGVPATIYLYTGAPNAEQNRQYLARGFDFVTHGGQGYVWTGGELPPSPPSSPPPASTGPRFSQPTVLGNLGLSSAEQQSCKLGGFSLQPTGTVAPMASGAEYS